MKRPALRPRTLVGLVLLLALVVAMVLNTKFLTPEELAAARPADFDPEATAQELFVQGQEELPRSAVPLEELVPALLDDTAGAAEQFDGVAPTETSYVFAVRATGTVTGAQAGTLALRVDGLPADPPIQVPTTNAINGTVVRDALGFDFADAPGQSDFQFVGDELKKLMSAEVADAVGDPGSVEGKSVTVVGAISVLNSGGGQPEAKPVSIQPISIEVGS